ncbi:MAG: hypothetical protein EHM48_09355 [Planctomycetaceae bacterium]|nr:MAG: hypothetical protein EHM48_09355 [Planctomycetaceae bacterium]
MKIVSIALSGLLVCGAMLSWSCRERGHDDVRSHNRQPIEHRNVVVEKPGHDRDVVIVEERPTRVIIVKEAPPPMRREVRPSPPSRDYVWIQGYYNYDDRARHYVWVNGHYVKPPRPSAKWEPDRWEKSGKDHKYQPGHWRD